MSFIETIKQCINRDEDWKSFYQNAMNENIVNAPAEEKVSIIEHIVLENEIDNALRKNDLIGTKRKIQRIRVLHKRRFCIHR